VLKITIELWPHGRKAEATVIGEGYVANDGTSLDPSIGNYSAIFCHEVDPPISCEIAGFDRHQKAWKLLYECLRVALGEK
jgi:hypothetical protein